MFRPFKDSYALLIFEFSFDLVFEKVAFEDIDINFDFQNFPFTECKTLDYRELALRTHNLKRRERLKANSRSSRRFLELKRLFGKRGHLSE